MGMYKINAGDDTGAANLNGATVPSGQPGRVPEHPNVASVLFDKATSVPKWLRRHFLTGSEMRSSTSSKGAASGGAQDEASIPARARVVVTKRIECTLRQHLENIKQVFGLVTTTEVVLIASDIAEGAHHLMQHGVDLSRLSLDHVMWKTEENEGSGVGRAGRAVLLPHCTTTLNGPRSHAVPTPSETCGDREGTSAPSASGQPATD